MEETLALLINQIRMVWRFRWLALLVATMVCVAGWAYVLLMPNIYEVEAKIFIDTRSLLRPLLRGLAVDANLREDNARLMHRTLLVRPNLESIARKTDMDLRAKTPEQFELLLANLATSIGISGTVKDNIYRISYQSQDAELATRVVEAVLNLFVEKSLGESRKDTSKTKAFVAKQIAEYETRLQSAELRLKEFKQRNVDLLSSSGNYFQRLEGMRNQMQTAQLAQREAETRVNNVATQLQQTPEFIDLGPMGAPASDGAPRVHANDARILALESNLDQLLLQYTERHPDIIATRRILKQLKAEREADLAAAPEEAAEPDAPGVPKLQNPVYQQLRVQYSEAQSDVATAAARVAEFERRITELERKVDTSLNAEAELKRLDRDYEVNKRNYEELVKRRESLNLADDVTQTTDDVQFNIIDPPRVPLVPVGPNRPVLNAGVFALGLGTGIGLVVLLGLMRPYVYTKNDVEDNLSLPVIGVVSRVWTRRETVRRRMEVATFGVGCVVLVAMLVGVTSADLMKLDLMGKLRMVDVVERVTQMVQRVI